MPSSDLPAAIPLTGRFVRLEPLEDSHIPGLAEAASDERIWGYSVRGDTQAYLAAAQKGRETGEQVPFTVRLFADGRLIGMSRLFEIDTAHRRLELGYTWYLPEFWGTAVNPDAKLLLLGHAFDGWGARRVQFKIHHGNLRSQAAVEKLGAVREGVLRAHMIQPDGSRRDSVVFSIIREEWPAVRAALEARLGRAKAH